MHQPELLTEDILDPVYADFWASLSAIKNQVFNTPLFLFASESVPTPASAICFFLCKERNLTSSFTTVSCILQAGMCYEISDACFPHRVV